jgi:hypothetical protein
MAQTSTCTVSAALIALTLGVTGQMTAPRDAPPLSTSDITIAAADTATEPGANAAESAKMGKEQGTQQGANQAVTPESDTAKIDQPARRNPTTGNDSSATDSTTQ